MKIPAALLISLGVTLSIGSINVTSTGLQNKKTKITNNEKVEKEKKKESEKKENEKKESLKEYFPAKVGYKWELKGKGMEFAGYKMEVIYVDKDRIQVRKDNTGTVISKVYEVTDEEIKEVFSKAESYDDTNYLDKNEKEEILLKAPIQVGNRWKNKENECEIVDIDATIETEKETFEEIVKVKVTRDGKEYFRYYKKGIGLIKTETTGDYPITETLLDYSFK